MGKISNFFKKFKANKHFELIIAIILCIIVVAIFLSGFFSQDNGGSGGSTDSFSQYNANLEKKLCDLILALGNVKTVNVAITYASGTQYVYAYETTVVTNSGTTTEKTEMVYVNGEPLLIQEIAPEILGIAVVATGSNNAVLKMQITEIVVKLFSINSSKIQIITYSN